MSEKRYTDEELTAAILNARNPQWQAIETAPKDGESILVSGGHHFWGTDSCPTEGCPMNFVTIANWREGDDLWQIGDDVWAIPTHWMPLPKPPGAG